MVYPAAQRSKTLAKSGIGTRYPIASASGSGYGVVGVTTAAKHSIAVAVQSAMKRILVLVFVSLVAMTTIHRAFGLSVSLPKPEIFFPKGCDTNRAEQIQAVLRAKDLKYLGGLTSYWEPEFSTTLVYDGDAGRLSAFLGALNQVTGLTVRLTFSEDLSKETGSALVAGSWWVKYSHTAPDTITVRINLAAETLGRSKFELRLPKTRQ